MLGLTYPVAFDEAGTFGSEWGRTTLYPTLLVLDPTGEVRARFHERVEGRLPDALDALR